MIVSTLCYLVRDGNWLMLLRNKKKHDVNSGKWIGIGGKAEAGETPEQCIRREISEESGLTAGKLAFRGMLYFFYEGEESETIHVYSCSDFSGDLKECSEGELKWIPAGQVLSLSLWEGDRPFLKRMLEGDGSEFCYRLWYDSRGNLVRLEEN